MYGSSAMRVVMQVERGASNLVRPVQDGMVHAVQPGTMQRATAVDELAENMIAVWQCEIGIASANFVGDDLEWRWECGRR